MQVRHILLHRAGRHHLLSSNLIRFSRLNSDLTELVNPTPDITYTATANMTGAQILAWLRANVDFSKLNIRSKIVVNDAIFSLWLNNGSHLSAYGTATHPTQGTVSVAFQTAYSGSTSDRWASGSTSVLASTQLNAGNTLTIFY